MYVMNKYKTRRSGLSSPHSPCTCPAQFYSWGTCASHSAGWRRRMGRRSRARAWWSRGWHSTPRPWRWGRRRSLWWCSSGSFDTPCAQRDTPGLVQVRALLGPQSWHLGCILEVWLLVVWGMILLGKQILLLCSWLFHHKMEEHPVALTFLVTSCSWTFYCSYPSANLTGALFFFLYVV